MFQIILRPKGWLKKPLKNESENLKFVPDHLKTQEMCNETMCITPEAFHLIPNRFKTQEMCIKAIEADPSFLQIVPDHFKMQRMCEAVQKRLCLLKYLPEWFVTQQEIKIWHDDDEFCNDDKLIKWYNDYKKRKAQEASIKKSSYPLLGILTDIGAAACQKMRKKRQKNCGKKHGLFCIG